MSLSISQPVKTFSYACIGFLARILVLGQYKDLLRQRVEVTTPINSWKRAYEGVHLWNSGLDPYSGNIFHEYPISLQFYKVLISYFNVDIAFAAIDVLTAILLHQSTYNQLIIHGQVSKGTATSRSYLVLLAYLFSPFTIISCASLSTSTFTNFLIAVISFILPLKPFRALACVLCAFLACNNIHYSTLIIPILLSLEYCSKKRSNNATSDTNQVSKPYYLHPGFRESLTTSFAITLAAFITLILTSYFLMGNSLSFLKSTYLFTLKIQDLTPNIGMFWYLFTEMFEPFLEFFIWVVQINAFVHVIPLNLHLKDHPFFALYIMILTSSITQPYPSTSNLGIITSLIPQWLDLMPLMKRGFVVLWSGITCLCLMPIFWHLWIVLGTANSNFYFGATQAFSVTLIFYLMFLLGAHHSFQERKKALDCKQDQIEEECQNNEIKE